MDGSKLKNAAEKEGIDAVMRLKSTINETNMVLFDHEGRITKYKSAKAIMDEFAKVRLKMLHDCSKERVELIQLAPAGQAPAGEMHWVAVVVLVG